MQHNVLIQHLFTSPELDSTNVSNTQEEDTNRGLSDTKYFYLENTNWPGDCPQKAAEFIPENSTLE